LQKDKEDLMLRRIFVLCVMFLAISSVAFAAVGYKVAGTDTGAITTLDIYGGVSNFDGSSLQLSIAGPAINGGTTTLVSGVHAIPVINSVVSLPADNGNAGQVYTLANGSFRGQILTIVKAARTGSETAVITPTTKTGFTTITIDAANDSVTLLYIDSTIGWIQLGGYGQVPG
jgi:hypothetical protein